MSFISYEFILFIIILLILYYLVPIKYRWMLLLCFSYLFYWTAGVSALLSLLFTTITVYAAARIIAVISTKKKRAVLVAALLSNFGVLASLKYAPMADLQLSFILPLGISYYTFQSTGYLIDVYWGKYPAEKNFARLALFVSFFPQLIQGPISRFDQLSQTLFVTEKIQWNNIAEGFERIVWGYFKKLVIADRILPVVLAVAGAPEEYTGVYVLIGALSYTINLYADFSGGIDITIGIARMLGISLNENFNCPFMSVSLAEYWRRWHMTLMQWFREYVFFPVSKCRILKTIQKITQRYFGKNAARRVPLYGSSIVVWSLTGIWHGANWNFVVWGLANCFILLLSQEIQTKNKKRWASVRLFHTAGYVWFQRIRTLLLVSALQMLEYYPNPIVAVKMLVSIVISPHLQQLSAINFGALGIDGKDLVVLVCSVALVILSGCLGDRRQIAEMKNQIRPVYRHIGVFVLFAVTIILGVYGIGYDASQFIYNQF